MKVLCFFFRQVDQGLHQRRLFAAITGHEAERHLCRFQLTVSMVHEQAIQVTGRYVYPTGIRFG